DKNDKLEISYAQAASNYRTALESGILKIMSKMGISVVSSYRGAQNFEAIGIGSQLINSCFCGTTSQVEGIGFSHVAEETLTRHAMAYSSELPTEAGKLGDPGFLRFRRGGEAHAVTPPVIQNLH